jgi:hypothetical protein
LPPFVIFTRVTISKDTIPPGIIVRAQEWGLMIEELIVE